MRTLTNRRLSAPLLVGLLGVLLVVGVVLAAQPVTVGERVTAAVVDTAATHKLMLSVHEAPRPSASAPHVVINAFMSSNTKTVQDPQGDFDDWIELYNPTDEAIDLAKMYLTDSDRSPRKWQFPTGATLAAAPVARRARTIIYDSKTGVSGAGDNPSDTTHSVSYTHLRAHETVLDLVCRLLLEKKKNTTHT